MSRPFKIPLSRNPIDAAMLSKILLRYDGANPMDLVHDFEKAVADEFGIQYAVASDSGTAAIHLALKALGVGPGDHVIAPTFTYVASISPILYLGAIPVLVDCEPVSWNMDPVLLRDAVMSCITGEKKPKAIIAVHTYGMPADMKAIMKVGEEFSIPVMEDAAEAIGSRYFDKPLGGWGTVGVLSFNNNKIMTTYGGGCVLTRQEETAKKILYWGTHSRMDKPYYQHDELGYNYRMSPMTAAAGLAGMEHLDQNVKRRREIFERYRRFLAKRAGVTWQQESQGCYSNRWFSTLTFDGDFRRASGALHENGIETRPLWKPMHQQPLFERCRKFLNGNSDRFFESGICLPSGNDLTDANQDEVIEIILKNTE